MTEPDDDELYDDGDCVIALDVSGWPVAVLWGDTAASTLPECPRPTRPMPLEAASALAGRPLDEGEQAAVEWGGQARRIHAEELDRVASRLRLAWMRRER